MPTIAKYKHRSINLRIGIPTLRHHPEFFNKCKTCGEKFQSSKRGKYFCRLSCYTASRKFAIDAQIEKAKRLGVKLPSMSGCRSMLSETNCAQCGALFFVKRNRIGKEKCCKKICRRRYFAARFDRWIASPERLALPQNYDEFLTQEILRCLVQNCKWKGHHLSLHMNLLHGVSPDEFKKIAGFNFYSGIVSAVLHEKLSKIAVSKGANPHESRLRKIKALSVKPANSMGDVAAINSKTRLQLIEDGKIKNPVAWSRRKKQISLEAIEHGTKARALIAIGKLVKEPHQCAVCPNEVRGMAYCCSKGCYQKFGKRNMTCTNCNILFSASKTAQAKAALGKPIFHSKGCATNYTVARRLQDTGTIDGETKSIRDWAKSAGIPVGTLRHRIRKQGLPLNEAIHKPIKSNASRSRRRTGDGKT